MVNRIVMDSIFGMRYGIWPMSETPLADDLRARIAEVGTTQKRLALEAGLNETFVRDILKGRSKSPSHDRLSKIYDALSRLGSHRAGLKMGRRASAVPIENRRFAATRWAIWGDDLDLAAERLGIPVERLRDIEAGREAPPQDLLIRFHQLMDIPLRWFSEGRWDGLPGRIAGRIAVADLELVPEWPGCDPQAAERSGNIS